MLVPVRIDCERADIHEAFKRFVLQAASSRFRVGMTAFMKSLGNDFPPDPIAR